jgi:hypothetical protein
MPRWSSWSRWTTRDQVLDGAELVSRRRERQGRHLQLRHQARRLPRHRTPRSPGPRSRPARPSPGSTRAASCAATTRVGEFYSVAVTNNRQQADTGTKMIHLGKNTSSSRSSPRASRPARPEHLPRPGAHDPSGGGARNYTQCDSLLIGDQCGAHTFPYIEVEEPDRQVEHEATTSKIGDDQLFYCRQRGMDARKRPCR